MGGMFVTQQSIIHPHCCPLPRGHLQLPHPTPTCPHLCSLVANASAVVHSDKALGTGSVSLHPQTVSFSLSVKFYAPWVRQQLWYK